jgi:hypothetical protein
MTGEPGSMRRVPTAPTTVPPVRGVLPIAMLNLRCAAVLLVVNLVPALGLAVVGGSVFPVTVAVYAVAVAVVPIALFGFPVGLLTAHLLRDEPLERVHVAVFAAVGAVLAVVLLAIWSGPSVWLALGFVEGALGAGGARWWSGRAHRRTALARPRPPAPEPEDALIDAELEGGAR